MRRGPLMVGLDHRVRPLYQRPVRSRAVPPSTFQDERDAADRHHSNFIGRQSDAHNLHDVDVDIPLGVLVVLTGGAGPARVR